MSETLLDREVSVEAPPNGHTARRLETRRRLLEAGTALIAESGLTAATTTAIAERAGVATGTFYLHFPDKHALFEVLVDDALAEMRSQLQPASASDSRADRRAAIERALEVAERRRDLIRAVFDRGETTDLADRIQDRIAASIEPTYAQRFAEQGLDRNVTVAAQARAAVLVRVIGWWAQDPSRARRDEVAQVLLDMDPLRMHEPGMRAPRTTPTDRQGEPR